MRLRFAPSPTGPLHIGGLRTALYNYLLAKKHRGQFVLRIEDTDQNRYMEGAEDYIFEALQWAGIEPDEGPQSGGEFGPYRQSERKELYEKYALELVERGYGYYAFDTPEELDAWRERLREKGIHSPKYDATTRMDMRNSLTMSDSEVKELMDQGTPYTVRIKVPDEGDIVFNDLIRDEVRFEYHELDDKVMLKTDGMPTYHLANIVDDHLMKITHVVRGEEWLSSTGHHVLLYRAFGWEDEMPVFAHLPLILNPAGSGKLSKRHGQKHGIPVFPISWPGETEEETFMGFREYGFLPEAMINFLALLGWNPGTEQELFSMGELIEAFSIDHIGKSGARFDIDKAKWFNQQYIIQSNPKELLPLVVPMLEKHGHADLNETYMLRFIELMQERVMIIPEFWSEGWYFFEQPQIYEMKMVRKRWKQENQPLFELMLKELEDTSFKADMLEKKVKGFIKEKDMNFGEVLPMFRIAMTGGMTGPDLFAMMELLGKEESLQRLKSAFQAFDKEVDSLR